MSGGYLGNLNEVYPGLHALLGERGNLRGTVDHIVDKARKTSRERGIHRLDVDQLITMIAYWEGLALTRKQRASDGEKVDFSWYGDRAHTYIEEMYERRIDDPHHPDKTLFGEALALFYGSKDTP